MQRPGSRYYQKSIYQLDAGVDQLTAVMTGADTVEVKGVAALDFMILEPVQETVITGIKEEPLDLKQLQELPGIVGYIVQEKDSLWDIAKKISYYSGKYRYHQ